MPFDSDHMRRPGHSLLEVLIILGMIGLVGTFAALAVNAARSRQRDATRLSQVRQGQSALEDYFGTMNSYPPGEQLPLGDSAQSSCLGTGGFKTDCSGDRDVFLRIIRGTTGAGLKGLVACGTPLRNAFCYTQRKGGDSYAIQFELENALPEVGIVKGVNCATPDGMAGGACR